MVLLQELILTQHLLHKMRLLQISTGAVNAMNCVEMVKISINGPMNAMMTTLLQVMVATLLARLKKVIIAMVVLPVQTILAKKFVEILMILLTMLAMMETARVGMVAQNAILMKDSIACLRILEESALSIMVLIPLTISQLLVMKDAEMVKTGVTTLVMMVTK